MKINTLLRYRNSISVKEVNLGDIFNGYVHPQDIKDEIYNRCPYEFDFHSCNINEVGLNKYQIEVYSGSNIYNPDRVIDIELIPVLEINGRYFKLEEIDY